MHVGADASGDFLAVWYQFGSLFSNRYTPSGGWSVAGLVETNDTAFARYSSAGFAPDGNALAAWVYPGSGGPDHVYASFFSPTAGWAHEVEIHPGGTGYAADTSVALSQAGTGFAVWDESGAGGITDIWAARFTTAFGWEAPEVIDSGADYAYAPDVAVDAYGNALVVWSQYNGTYEEVEAAWNFGGVWAPAQMIGYNDSADDISAQVALSAAGDALAVWTEAGAAWNIVAANYVAQVGWQPATLVEHRDGPQATSPQVAMDAYDSGCVVWVERSISGVDDALQNCFQKGGGWGQEDLLERDDAHAVGTGASPIDIAMDATGVAIATWAQSDGVESSAWAAARTGSGGWEDRQLLETAAGGGARAPAVAMGAGGVGMAVWGQDVFTHSRVMANRYVVPDTQPPYLYVAEPSYGTVTNVSTVRVSGFAEAGSSVVVNGVGAAVAGDGTFSVWVALPPGDSLIRVEANDASGIPTIATIPITFEDPVPVLEARLGEANAALNESVIAVAALVGELNDSQANLTATQADLNSTQADVAAAQAAVAAAQASLTQAQASLTAAQASVVALGAELAAVRANATAQQSHVETLESSSAAANASAAAAEASARAARDQVAGASTMALLGVLLGIGGLAVGALAMIRGGRGGSGQAARGWDPAEKKEIVGEASPKKPE